MVSSPDLNFSASPSVYSALRWERPAVRSSVISLPQTWVGVGNLCRDASGSDLLKRATNLALIDFAAAPDTLPVD